MVTLMDLYNQQTDSEKEESRRVCEGIYQQSVSLHNGAIAGLIPMYHKIEGVEGFIKQEAVQ